MQHIDQLIAVLAIVGAVDVFVGLMRGGRVIAAGMRRVAAWYRWRRFLARPGVA